MTLKESSFMIRNVLQERFPLSEKYIDKEFEKIQHQNKRILESFDFGYSQLFTELLKCKSQEEINNFTSKMEETEKYNEHLKRQYLDAFTIFSENMILKLEKKQNLKDFDDN
jgi:hypothetical protein